jgi:hypothetical protein
MLSMFFVMIYVYALLPLVYEIFQRRCCRNFIYGCQMCSSVAFRGVCGLWGVTARDTNCVVVLAGLSEPWELRRKLTRSKWPFERGKGLKETRSLWPPQRGLGSLESNLGKTNHRVHSSYFLVDLFSPSLPDSDLILTLTSACSLCFKL